MKCLLTFAVLCLFVSGLVSLPQRRGVDEHELDATVTKEDRELRRIKDLIRKLEIISASLKETNGKENGNIPQRDEGENVQHRGGDENVPHRGGDENVQHRGEDENVQHRGGDENVQLRGEDENVPRRGEDENVPHRGEDKGYLFDNPQDLNPESDLEVILDSMVIENNGEEHKAVGINRKPNYGDSHDHHRKVVKAGGGKRNFVFNDESELWPDMKIPYEIDRSNFSAEDIVIIENGIQEFHDLTCLKWIPRAASGHQYYVRIVNGKDGCWSYVGLVAKDIETSPYQKLSLQSPGCMTVGTVVHELLHAAGAVHEQSREDRDKYLDIIWTNIEESEANNFDIEDGTKDEHPYDVESVLQYDLTSFSMNGHRTMRLKDWRLEFLPNSVDGMTYYDILDVTISYKCTDSCPEMYCKNAGFVDWKCGCYCPKDLGGETCTETISVGNCGGTIKVGEGKHVFIQSPNYPANYEQGLKCTWLIEGVPDNILRGTIVDMDISNNNLACYHWIEIRYNLLGQSGPRRCGKTHYEAWDASKDEFKNKMIVQFDSFTGSDKPSSKGFKMKFESIGTGCINKPCVFGKCNSPLNTDKYTCTCDNGFTGTKCDTPSVDASIGCTAEVGKYCMLSQNTDDDFDWDFETERVKWLDNDVGPLNAYQGWLYLYAGAIFTKKGARAVMSTTLSFPAVNRCLKFRYFIKGDDIGTLNVYTENKKGNKNLVFSDFNDHGRSWIEAQVNIPATEGLKISFEAVVGSKSHEESLYFTDMALDDIWLVPGVCGQKTLTTTTTTTSDVCEDKITDCADYEVGVCQSNTDWAQENCPNFCNLCTELETNPVTTAVSTTPAPQVCEDKITDCDANKDDICDTYRDWAKENCMKFCNLCDELETNPVTTAVSTTPAPKVCEDKITDCDANEDDICDTYRDWAMENCMKFCNLCDELETNPVTTAVSTTPAPQVCEDKITDCDANEDDICDTYRDWAMENCMKFCNLCDELETNPVTTAVSTTPAPKVCEDKITDCGANEDDICDTYRDWAMENCMKFCNLCDELETNPVTTAVSTTPAPKVCEDKITDCDANEDDICDTYRDWAKENCMKFCNLCDELETNPVTTAVYTTPAPKVCEDKITDCDANEDDICDTYRDWAMENCMKFCNLCDELETNPVTTAVSTTPASKVCEDKITDCDANEDDICDTYRDWAMENCMKFCNLCDELETNPVTTAVSSTPAPQVCEDKITDCDANEDDICDAYRDWAMENCMKFCNLCDELETNPVTTGVSTTPAPQVCEDKITDCDANEDDICDTYRDWAMENCMKFCNLCDELETIPVTTAVSTTPAPQVCEDKITDCDANEDDICDTYRDWAMENCMKFCNLCDVWANKVCKKFCKLCLRD